MVVEKKEHEIISAFLPKQLSEEETKNILNEIIKKLNASSIKDMGKVMGVLKKDYSDRMSKIKCPTKILWGRYDELFPIKCAAEFQKRIDNSSLIHINGSHDWPIFNPEKIQGYI